MSFISFRPPFTAFTTRQVLVAPARTPPIAGRPAQFMFVLSQVVDILRETAVYPIPFSLPHVPGITEWHGRVVPVLDLEGCLDLAPVREDGSTCRWMAVRTRNAPVAAILRVNAGMKLISPPSEARAAGEGLAVPPRFVRGVYAWPEGLLIVPHLENILSGKFVTRQGGTTWNV